MKIHELSAELGATYDDNDDSITLYDTRGESPTRREHLSSGEMVELMSLYINGSCPVCLEEIPQDDIVCGDCFQRAASARA